MPLYSLCPHYSFSFVDALFCASRKGASLPSQVLYASSLELIEACGEAEGKEAWSTLMEYADPPGKASRPLVACLYHRSQNPLPFPIIVKPIVLHSL